MKDAVVIKENYGHCLDRLQVLKSVDSRGTLTIRNDH